MMVVFVNRKPITLPSGDCISKEVSDECMSTCYTSWYLFRTSL